MIKDIQINPNGPTCKLPCEDDSSSELLTGENMKTLIYI